MLSLRKSLFLLLVLLCAPRSVSSQLQGLREKFDSLDDRGKVVAGGIAGYVGSRLVVKSTMNVLKLAGAGFLL